MPSPILALSLAGLLVATCLLLFWPRRGLLVRWQQARRVTARVQTEDALKHIHKWEMRGRRPTVESVAGALQTSGDGAAELLVRMEALGLLAQAKGDFQLTPQGRSAALHIIRAHRLWERYLADQTGFDESQWHEQADHYEHTLQPEDVDALSARLGNPTHDPHGDPIPTSGGELIPHGGQPLTALALDTPGRIVHLEDEPETVYAQLVAEGLHPGMQVRITEIGPQRVRFWANGDEHVLAPIVAANISVRTLPEEEATNLEARLLQASDNLSMLQPGESGIVTQISPRCRGQERRRLMDLGILPGTPIWAEMISPGGDPTAYRIREALIALRREQAEMVQVRRQGNGEW